MSPCSVLGLLLAAMVPLARCNIGVSPGLGHCTTRGASCMDGSHGSDTRMRMSSGSYANVQLRGLRGGGLSLRPLSSNESSTGSASAAIDALIAAGKNEEAMMQAITLSHQLYKARQLEESLAVAEKAVTCARNIHGEADHMDVAQALNNKGVLFASLEQYDQALPLLEQALPMMKSVLGETNETVIQALHNVAMVYLSSGRIDEADAKCAECIAALQEQGKKAFLTDMLRKISYAFTDAKQENRAIKYDMMLSKLNTLADFWDSFNQGVDLCSEGELVKSIGSFQQALDMLQVISPPPENAAALTAKCFIYSSGVLFQAGQLEQAEQTAREGLNRLSLAPAESVDLEDRLTGLHGLGRICVARGMHGEALKPSEDANALHLELHGPNNPDRAMYLVNLGTVLLNLAKYKEAEEHLRGAREAYLNRTGDLEAMNSTLLGPKIAKQLATALLNLKRDSEALPLFEEAVREDETLGAFHDGERAVTLMSMAHAQLGVQQYPECVASFSKAIALLRETHGDENQLVVASLFRMGEALTVMDQPLEALAKLTEALAIQRKLDSENKHVLASLHGRIAKLQWNERNWEGCIENSEEEQKLLAEMLGEEDTRVKDAAARASAAKFKMAVVTLAGQPERASHLRLGTLEP